MSADEEDPFRRVRLDKLETLRGMGIDPYPVGFAREHQAAELDRRYADIPAGTETGDRARVAGRIRATRNSGMFIDLHDASGKIQVFSHKDYLRAEDLPLLRLLDIGELIGVEGLVRRTPRGELTVNAEHLTMLAKALPPQPHRRGNARLAAGTRLSRGRDADAAHDPGRRRSAPVRDAPQRARHRA